METLEAGEAGEQTPGRGKAGDGATARLFGARLFGGRAWPLAGRGVLLLAVLISAATPIVVFDTDLWYHLRHARHLFETGQIVDATDFSYLPERPFTNYYWLFQVLALGVFQAGGYGGLIALRTLIWAALLWGVDRLMRPARGATGALVPALVALLVLDRALNLRPHLLSYTGLVFLLLAFEKGSGKAGGKTPLWPVAVAILWSNLHGVSFPVIWAIVGAYGAETLVELWRSRRTRPAALRRLGVLAATGLSVLATPHGVALLAVPFRSTADASRFIEELQPFDPSSLLRLDLSRFGSAGAFTVLAWLLVALLLSRLPANLATAKRRFAEIRLSRPLLLLAGLILVAKANRLQVEAALLALPLLRDLLSPWAAEGKAADAEGSPSEAADASRYHRLVGVASAALLALLAFTCLDRTRAALRLPHPLNDGTLRTAGLPSAGGGPAGASRLPAGAAAFLARHGGADEAPPLDQPPRVMQQADHGGYWMWALGDRFRIHMDLELPFAFSAGDYFELLHAYYDEAALATMLERHRPDFIAVDARPAGFGERLRAVAPRYVPVFVDDAVVLWADGERHGELTSRWRITAFDAERALADRGYRPPREARGELLRLREQVPRMRLPHRLLARLALASRDGPAALEHAEDLLALASERGESHLILGDALMANGRIGPAKAAFERALELTPPADRRPIHRRLAYVELELERPRAAYEHLRRVVDVDVLRGSVRDLELLARLAEDLGERKHAAQLRAILELRSARP